MNISTAQDIFARVRNGWVRSTWAACIVLATAIACIAICVLYFYYAVSLWWIIPALFCIAVILIFLDKSWRINDHDIAGYLDKKFPELEESTLLVLSDPQELNLLQGFQAERTKKKLIELAHPQKLNPRLKSAAVMLICSVAATLFLLILKSKSAGDQSTDRISSAGKTIVAVRTRSSIAEIKTTVQPPAYLNAKTFIQSGGPVHALAGSKLSWEVRLSKPVSELKMTINDVKRVSFSADKDSTIWDVQMQMPARGFYQLTSPDFESPLYQLETITDRPPEVRVQSPQPDLLIKFGQPEKCRLTALLKDDYGIGNAKISATVSRGSGEAVKFEQKSIPLNLSFAERAREYTINQTIDLRSLGMIPGDELYLFVTAIDILRQETRSDIFRIILEDTAQLFSMEGLNSGLDIKPEFFRSQRQIIIETEQLLRDKNSMTAEAFKEKSNSLGIDQKLLRLRYGKFLGEEASTYESGGAEEGHEEHNQTSNEKKTADIISEFGHSHDNAEDATYFDAETKKQLRATLNEMWKSELQLRTFLPKDALPFEYEALRLLKDLQQKSRVYVAKTNLKTTPLKPETRLTGDLKDIIQPVYHFNYEFKPAPEDPVRESLGIFSDIKAGLGYDADDLEQLKKAHQVLSRYAMDEPSLYLSALKSFREILPALEEQKPFSTSALVQVEKAFQRLLSIPGSLPLVQKNPADDLSGNYYKMLQKNMH